MRAIDSRDTRRGESPVVPVDTWSARYGAELERHVERMLGSRDEARDIVQELWVTALRAEPEWGEGTNIRAWLYRVATRRALDVIAARRRHHALLEARSTDLAPEGPPGPDAATGRLSPEGAERVRAGVAALPPRQRDAVWLRWIEGRDYGTIASRLGISRDAARANVYQGLRRLRRDLAGVWFGEEAP